MKRIGMLTSGGDCQGLNAALHGVAKALYEYYDEEELQIYGIRDGYRGLMDGEYQNMKREDFSGILCRGGTILGTSRQPFKLMRVVDELNGDKIAAMKQTFRRLALDFLVILGGNGTHKTANLLREEGLPVVTLPKTIDNDIWGTDLTFGFQSAVDIATGVLDCIHTTATSHGRVFVVELMGHKAGWLALHAGIAGGADVILLPEFPYSMESVTGAIRRRNQMGKNFSIIAVAEGALSKAEAQMTKKERKATRAQRPYPSVAYQIAGELEEATGQEVRVTVPGHIQRGGSPCPFDRTLATRFGAAAAQLIVEDRPGFMVALRDGSIVPVPLQEAAGRLKTVPPDSGVVQTARHIGICLGDDGR